MGVPLQHGAVHERAGVPLVGVAHDVLLLRRALAGGVPLEPGGEARAPPAPQTGDFDFLNDLLRRHGGEGLPRRLIAPGGDVILHALRVDDPAAAQDNAGLSLQKAGVLRGDGPFLHHRAPHQVALHKLRRLVRLDLHIPGLKGPVVPVHVHDGLQIAGPHAAGELHRNSETLLLEQLCQRAGGLAGPGGHAAAALSYYHSHAFAPSSAWMSRRMALTLSRVRFP